MKNKHLLLLFLLTLAVGLLSRWSPWLKADTVQTTLIAIDSNAIQYLTIRMPHQPDIRIERQDTRWLASQEDLTVNLPGEAVQSWLQALSLIRSSRIVHTRQLDTCLLDPGQSIQVSVALKDKRQEHFHIGREATIESGRPVSYVMLEQHQGVYLAAGHLRQLFQINLDSFRNRTVIPFLLADLDSLHCVLPGVDTLVWGRLDSTDQWVSGDRRLSGLSGEMERALNQLSFAKRLELTLLEEPVYLRLELYRGGVPQQVELDFYGLRVKELPGGGRVIEAPRGCLLQSSANADNFFTLRVIRWLSLLGGAS